MIGQRRGQGAHRRARQVALARGVHGSRRASGRTGRSPRRTCCRSCSAPIRLPAGAADLQVAHGDAHAAAQVRGARPVRSGGPAASSVRLRCSGVHEVARTPAGATSTTRPFSWYICARPSRCESSMMSVFVCGFVDAGLDDGGGHQHVEPLARAEDSSITLLQRFLAHLAVRHAHARLAWRPRLDAPHRVVDGADASWTRSTPARPGPARAGWRR